ncbi:AAA family ATPase [Idiomarina sp. PL1-037]|uniref:AAA family ATPase n=1 Tax=Idiomarina sp. PL1-037 TaxID=3095365 RepID=UPI002ACC03CF|nr:AAA family ATPase [Idiomarina sp. PL1-037]WQC53531.1 AAA family ATPase [Idiomarina sp. PL1-037]
MADNLFPRNTKQNLIEAIDDTPVVLIHGLRQCGKTTLVKFVGELLGYTYITFDDENQLAATKADPVVALYFMMATRYYLLVKNSMPFQYLT